VTHFYRDLVLPLAQRFAWEALTEAQRQTYLERAKGHYHVGIVEVNAQKTTRKSERKRR
jgi:hypothetical protein